MEEYIRLEEEKARKRSKVFNWETAKYGKIWYDEDIHNLRSVETEFPDIAFNDEASSKKTLSCEPTVSSLNDEIDFRISFDDSDDEDYTCLSGDNPECIFNFLIESVFPDCLYGVSKPHGYGVLTFWTLSSLFFSTVDMAYSLNEYNVFDTGINTAYPGEWVRCIDFLYSFRPREGKSTNIGGEFTNLEILECWCLVTSRRLFNMKSCSINQHGESTEQISGEFLILILFNYRI
ncbi:hypothetical protein Tco_0285162 [Tanacetum coccineum]